MKQTKVVEFSAAGELATGDYSGAIGIVDSMEPHAVIKTLQQAQLSHIVQKTGIAFDREIAVANSMSANLSEFLDHPMQTILGSDQQIYPSLTVVSAASDNKKNTLDQLEEFMKSISGTRRIRESAIMMADELFTNASKNGGSMKKLRIASQEERGGKVEFFASADSSRLVLGCRDSYGELGFSQVLNRINNCFENGIANSINHGEGGAGIGSFLVFNGCISYYCGVEKGKRTVVCVALPLGVSAQDTDTMPKNVHLRAA